MYWTEWNGTQKYSSSSSIDVRYTCCYYDVKYVFRSRGREKEKEIPRYKYTNTNKWNRTKHSTLWSNAGTSTRNAPMLKHNANIILIYCAYNNEAHKLVTLWCSFDCFSLPLPPPPFSLSVSFSLRIFEFTRLQLRARTINTDACRSTTKFPRSNRKLQSQI